MITSLIEMLELSNFGHMGTSTIQTESRNKIFVNNVINRNYDFIIVISKYLYFKNALFLDITKVDDFWSKNTDVSKTYWASHVIYIYFESSFGKV